MNARRLALYFALLVLLAALGLGLALWGLFACAPPPLPGDELWTWRQNAGAALGLVLRFCSTACFTQQPAGTIALALGIRTAGMLLVVLALIVLWETLGRDVRRRWFRLRGGHRLLAGTLADTAGLARAPGGLVFLAPDRAAALDLARRHPFAEIAILDPRILPRQLARYGAGKARLVAAVTRSDLSNVAIADAALAAPGTGELLVRLEQHAIRTLSSHRLRLAAGRAARPLAIVALTQLQTRRGLAAAMPGRFAFDPAPRIHIVICGSGPALQAASFEIARQGFGLETEPPLLSLLRTGSADFAAGTLDRLRDAGIAQLRIADVPATTADALDRAIAASLEDAPPLVAVHCVGDSGGEAEALALRWEEALLALHQPIPPIVAYGVEDRPLGSTGMIRIAAADDLAEAREAARLMDRRARAVHELFLTAQRAARGGNFGTAPAETDWPLLPESFQDDNRNVADQMDYKLACIGMLARPAPAAAGLDPAQVETLARIAHARWLAARALAGWRHGAVRDDRRMFHPDMVTYDQLDEAGRQKDRDEVASLPGMAALAGDALLAEHRIGPQSLRAAAPAATIAVVVLPLGDPAALATAETLLAGGALIDAQLDRATAALRLDPALAPRLAAILRRAWRITIVRHPASPGATDALA